MMIKQVSDHFTWEQVQATSKDIENEIPYQHCSNAVRLAEEVLEPLWVFIGPIRVNSWFRCPQVNAAVGGEKTSAHLEARAADIVPTGDVFSKFKMALTMLDELPIDKIIFEKRRSEWIHVQVAKEGSAPRRLAFTAKPNDEGKMVYTPYHA